MPATPGSVYKKGQLMLAFFIVNLKPPPMEVVIGSGAMPKESPC